MHRPATTSLSRTVLLERASITSRLLAYVVSSTVEHHNTEPRRPEGKETYIQASHYNYRERGENKNTRV